MARVSPLRSMHQQAEAHSQPYGPPEGAVDVVQTFGDLELEYASLRKHCVLIDQPQRAVLEVRGADRLEFLNRMVTQDLKGLPPFRLRRAFWLNKKGRIDADLRIIDLPQRTLLELDVLAAERTLKGLGSFIVMEEVSISDVTERVHRLSLHGRTGLELLAAIGHMPGGAEASGPGFDELLPDRACVVKIGDAEVVVYREDTAGETGLELVVPAPQAARVYQHLIEAGHAHDTEEGESPAPSRWRLVAQRVRLRPAGWHAYNIARLEAGTPLYNLDFGPESLPAESGVLSDRVSFTKGCYLGQEIVARMHSRGQVKQMLVGLRFNNEPDTATGLPRLPVAGTPLTPPGDANPVGVVTSSVLSPMLGSTPIALAQVRASHAAAGTVLQADGLAGTVQPQGPFWRR